MSKGYKFGQILGIVVGVIAGSMIVNAILSPPRRVIVVEQASQPYMHQVPMQQPGVF